MKVHNTSGTLEEAARIVCRMSQEERDEFYKEMFRYNPSRPCVENARTGDPVLASSASL